MDIDIVLRIAQRGLRVAQGIANDSLASYYVDGDELVDLFQHMIDELERVE